MESHKPSDPNNRRHLPQRLFKQRDIKSFCIFLIIALVAYVVVNFFKQPLSKITEVILTVELAFLVIATWTFAAHAVIRSLFAVSVELSLIIFLSQAYCATPSTSHTADDALMTLVGVGMTYIGLKFFWTIMSEVTARSKALKKDGSHIWPWLLLPLFAIFTGLFIWQVVQVLTPVIQDICVYKSH